MRTLLRVLLAGLGFRRCSSPHQLVRYCADSWPGRSTAAR
jgi:hypothetical protein